MRRCEIPQCELDTFEGQASHLVQACTPQHTTGIAGVQGEALQVTRIGIGVQNDRVGLRTAMLVHKQSQGTRPRVRERQLQLDLIIVDRFPAERRLLPARIAQLQTVQAADAAALQTHGVLAPDDERRLLAIGQRPRPRWRIRKIKAGPVVVVEAPGTAQRRVHAFIERHRSKTRRVDHIAAPRRIGPRRQIDVLGFGKRAARHHQIARGDAVAPVGGHQPAAGFLIEMAD